MVLKLTASLFLSVANLGSFAHAKMFHVYVSSTCTSTFFSESTQIQEAHKRVVSAVTAVKTSTGGQDRLLAACNRAMTTV